MKLVYYIVGQSGCQESIHDSGHYITNYIEQFSEIMFSAIRQKLKWCVLWNHTIQDRC